MFKKLVLIAVVLTALLATASPALAATGSYYVATTGYEGTESGTSSQPYKTLDKAIAAAQANPDGGYIYMGPFGSYRYWGYVQGVNTPGTGVPISRIALFGLLGLASLILVAAGWYLRRRSGTLPSHA